MIRRLPMATWGLAVACPLLLSACAHPNPGPNAAAAAVQAPPDVPLATKPGVGRELAAVAENKGVVSFSEGGAMIRPEDTRQLDLAARLFRDASPTVMFVSGHSDTLGDEYGNVLLSAQRAQVVKQALVARGIPASKLLLQALGTSEPIDNADPASPENRSVVITWRLI